MERIACTECGALVLRSTHERNEGRCAPCAKGTRARIDSARRDAEEARRNPARNYWIPLVRQSSDRGFQSFSQAQRICYCIGLLDIEVFDGGIEQFFTNTAGGFFKETEAALEALNLSACHALLLRAKEALFGEGIVPRDRWERMQTLSGLEADPAGRRILDELTKRYREESERAGLPERMAEFAARNELTYVFPAPEGHGAMWEAR